MVQPKNWPEKGQSNVFSGEKMAQLKKLKKMFWIHIVCLYVFFLI